MKKDRYEIEARAEDSVRRGKYNDAVKQYQKLLVGDERDIPVRNTLSEIYFKLDKKDKALKELREVGFLYEKRGMFAMAIAVFKRINRLNPADVEVAKHLAALFERQGFISEAKAEYSKLAMRLEAKKEAGEAMALYEKLLKIDREDIQVRLALANLYIQEKMDGKAVDQLNEVAEINLRNESIKEAREAVDRARALIKDHPRTLANLIDVLRKENKLKEALKLVDEILEKDKDNLKALYLSGNLYLKEMDFEKAEKIFQRIITLRPTESEARIRLGQILIQKGLLDKAFDLYEPLVDALLRKSRGDKAIGLLGLLISSRKIHLPTLEKLAAVYKARKQAQNQLIVCRVLWEQYCNKRDKAKMLKTLRELVSLVPENDSYYYQLQKLKAEMGLAEEEETAVASERMAESEKVIRANLAKVELYAEQGLFRNARRILEGLKIRFPGEPRVLKKIEELESRPPELDTDEIPERVEKVAEKEEQLFGENMERYLDELDRPPAETRGRKGVTTSELFLDMDIIPFDAFPGVKRRFYDLTARIEEEKNALQGVIDLQRQGEALIDEQELSAILAEFRRDVEEKVGSRDVQSRFNLGIAFYEQDLVEEAIREFRIAAEDPSLRAECYSLISGCYRKKNELVEAAKWAARALDLSPEGGFQSFAIKYDLAAILEKLKKKKQALELYQEIKNWDKDYREVGTKIETLKKK